MNITKFKEQLSIHYPKLSYDDFQDTFLSSLQTQNLIAKTADNFHVCLKEALISYLDTHLSLFENILNRHNPIHTTLKQTPQWNELEKKSTDVKRLKFTLIGYGLTTSTIPYTTLNEIIQLTPTLINFTIQIHNMHLTQLQKENDNIYKPQTNYA